MRSIFAAAALTLLIGAGCIPVTPAPTPAPAPTTSTYTNSKLGFSVEYPKDVVVIDDKATMETSGYIPACDPTNAVACFLVPQSAYAGKNFDSAGLAVNVLADKKTEAACLAADGNMKAAGIVTVGGVAFTTFTDGDAAMSHRSDGTDALAFHDGTCYELTTRTNTTVFEVYAPGLIQKFTDQDQAAVTAKMDAMLQGFRFTAK